MPGVELYIWLMRRERARERRCLQQNGQARDRRIHAAGEPLRSLAEPRVVGADDEPARPHAALVKDCGIG
jgi:hypothetical protein